jgi:two-component system, OmpR family, phosphate regulon sensor histidine kinase PhoR
MLSNSRYLALLLAISVSAITTLFLSLVPEIRLSALLVTFILSFGSTYILSFLIIEYFIFSHIDQISRRLNHLTNDQLSFSSEEYLEKGWQNPIKRINAGIYRYAERKQQEIEELKKAETFRREFLADISHELKTPIFAAQGFVHTLLDGAVKDKNVRTKFLKKAAKSLDGLDRLVQDLLTISKMETGEIRMDFDHFNLHFLVLDVFDQFENKAEKKGMKMKMPESIPTDVFVYADRQKIMQVLSNLVSNAIKYKREGEGELSISYSALQEEVEISVRDNGMGIPEEHLGRIFERFYRVDKSRSKDRGGTGLGLSIVKHILERHQSQISVRSKPGEGSEFVFRLRKGVPKPEERSATEFW